MRTEAADTGAYTSAFNGQKFPRIQIRTIEQLMAGIAIERPGGNVAMMALARFTANQSCEIEHLEHLSEREVMMGHHFAENGSQGAGAERVVIREGQLVLATGLRGEAAM